MCKYGTFLSCSDKALDIYMYYDQFRNEPIKKKTGILQLL